MDRGERIGHNEAIFREVNERVREVSEVFTATAEDELLPLVCECGDATCTERITLPREAYRRVRSDGTLFAVRAGHDAPDVESVVEDGGAYQVVRKHPGRPAELAEATDPKT